MNSSFFHMFMAIHTLPIMHKKGWDWMLINLSFSFFQPKKLVYFMSKSIYLEAVSEAITDR